MAVAHRRQVIRDAVVALLDALPPIAGRVTAGRVLPVVPAELPAVIVYTLEETIVARSLAETQTRDLRLSVAIRDSGFEDELPAQLDALAALAETALADHDLGVDGVLNAQLESSTVQFEAVGETAIGTLSLVYRIQYRTSRPAPNAGP